MMQFLKENTLMVVVGVVVLAGAFLYFTVFSGVKGEALVSSDTASPVSRDLLLSLSNLHTIQLDDTIFSDPVFLSLTDFGVTLPPENVGRPNPFASLGSK